MQVLIVFWVTSNVTIKVSCSNYNFCLLKFSNKIGGKTDWLSSKPHYGV